MRLQFSIRSMFLFVLFVAILLWVFTPVARVNSATCKRIVPGMTVEQAQKVIGVPPGWYDGIHGIQPSSPDTGKEEPPSWVGLNGELILDLDESGRVVGAKVYSIRILNWSLTDFLWERFTRNRYVDLTAPACIGVLLALTGIATFTLALFIIGSEAKNSIAYQGLIGLILCPVLSVGLFWDRPSKDMDFLVVSLFSPILGAILGVFVGFLRALLSKWFRGRRSLSKFATTQPIT